MSSFRKKQFASPDTDAPVTTAPTEAAKPPEPVAGPKPLPEIETKSPADAAATSALRDRLREMDRAEQFARQGAQPPPPPPQAQPQQAPEPPAALKKWIAEHPCYFDPRDPLAQQELDLATKKCLIREGIQWTDDGFIPALERHLGIAQAANGYAESRRVEPARPATPAPRPAAPQRMATPGSAPPHREVPSMSTGRPVSHRAPLTRDELEIATASGVSADEYQRQKERLARLKASGAIQ